MFCPKFGKNIMLWVKWTFNCVYCLFSESVTISVEKRTKRKINNSERASDKQRICRWTDKQRTHDVCAGLACLHDYTLLTEIVILQIHTCTPKVNMLLTFAHSHLKMDFSNDVPNWITAACHMEHRELAPACHPLTSSSFTPPQFQHTYRKFLRSYLAVSLNAAPVGGPYLTWSWHFQFMGLVST